MCRALISKFKGSTRKETRRLCMHSQILYCQAKVLEINLLYCCLARIVLHHSFLLATSPFWSTGQGALNVSPCCGTQTHLTVSSAASSMEAASELVSGHWCSVCHWTHFYFLQNCAVHCTFTEVSSCFPLSRLNGRFTDFSYVYAAC